ncbi:MAG TPA: SH3 domain-containing protein [Clostridiaceae bacterium]|nr:SH3 domain-containing protein [Clostridiaceae bacterium]
MRRKRKIDVLLMTTALVLVAALFVAFSIRLIINSREAEPAALFANDDELTPYSSVIGVPPDGKVHDVTSSETVRSLEDEFEIAGFIDRNLPDLEYTLQPIDTSLEELDGSHEKTTTPTSTISAPRSPKTTKSATKNKTTSTRDPKAFESVDIRYYANSKVGLNLRESPSTNSEIIEKLEYGTSLRVIGLSKEWAKVRLPGKLIGYVSRDFITKYRPATEPTKTVPPTTTTAKPATRKTTTPKTTTVKKTTKSTTVKTTSKTTTPQTTTAKTTTKSTTEKTTVKPPEGPFQFVNPPSGGSNKVAHTNFNLIKQYGFINKEGSPSINRHYDSFTDNGDGTITVDGMTLSYVKAMPGRRATFYDGLAVCEYQIKRYGVCKGGHTTPVNHPTASGILAQRGIVAVSKADASIYPRGTVVFVRGYGMAVVGDRSGGCFDLCYDAGECWSLTRRNWTNGIYIITSVAP